MKKIIWLFLSLQTLLFGCAACSLMVPSVEVEADFKEKLYLRGNQLKSLPKEIGLLKNLKELYLSGNILESLPTEIQNISEAMLDYIKPKEMLTSIQYAAQSDNEPRLIKPKYKNFKLQMLDGFLLFSYDAILNLEISKDATLSMAFEDDESFFAFIITELTLESSDFSYTKNLYLFSASVSFIEKMTPENFEESTILKTETKREEK